MTAPTANASPGKFALAIHGGAGTLRRGEMNAERAAQYHAGLRRALQLGRDVLVVGGSALDAVTAAVVALEDESLFNAGRGAVFTAAGTQEMDAAVMDGRERRAGSVAGICGPKNPVLAARAVMEHSPHVLLIGKAPSPSAARRASPSPKASISTPRAVGGRCSKSWSGNGAAGAKRTPIDEARRHGTVGAVARDKHGNLAAATSTGGMTGKLPGRVGDSPIIGAGTYADNGTCAVSATGHGEFFIRFGAAHEIAARIRHGGLSLREAACEVVDELGHLGGSGGLVAVGRDGELALPFNCSGMYRGYVETNGIVYTAIYDEAYRSV